MRGIQAKLGIMIEVQNMGHDSAFKIWYKNGGFLLLVGIVLGIFCIGLYTGIEFTIWSGGLLSLALLGIELFLIGD